ncbi:unnamed protein product [Meloidogyne enterolobii]|uniref:Uncharacterized protein n=1 Tax=Meloidogyne enterolobii TaxID=390850 RepID=A0ACB0YZ58_MELEN
MEYSHIEICLKFENPGNYFIILLKSFTEGFLQFYVKIKKAKEDKCVIKMFKKMSDLEREVLKGLRHSISINIIKTEENDIEDGQMNVFNEGFEERYNDEIEFVALIYPILNDGIYKFYLDEEGITREKVMFNTDTNNEIINIGNKNEENPSKNFF